jgi:uncharacterized membrane protein YeaQ/YmgE (transglycosylase-associated protein family)
MTFLIILLVSGAAVGAAMNSFMNNRGNGLGFPLSISLGAVTSVVIGILLVNFGSVLVGDGPDSLLALIGGPVAAVIVILLVKMIKK